MGVGLVRDGVYGNMEAEGLVLDFVKAPDAVHWPGNGHRVLSATAFSRLRRTGR